MTSYKKIKLTQGKYAIVDAEDFEELNKFRWSIGGRRYASRTVCKPKRHSVLMHRVILKAEPHQIIDHIDGDGFNNRKSNLRFCTKAENTRNSKMTKRNISGFKGVSRGVNYVNNPWVVRITFKGVLYRIGTFKTPEEAHEAYKEAAKKYHGEFAKW